MNIILGEVVFDGACKDDIRIPSIENIDSVFRKLRIPHNLKFVGSTIRLAVDVCCVRFTAIITNHLNLVDYKVFVRLVCYVDILENLVHVDFPATRNQSAPGFYPYANCGVIDNIDLNFVGINRDGTRSHIAQARINVAVFIHHQCT